MQTNNEYYKEICENMGISIDAGVHNNNYYLKKIAVEGYGLLYTGTVCNGILIKDIAEQITGNTYTENHFNNFYLKDIAHALTGEDYNKQFDNYYLNIWANNIVRKEETTLSWTPPTNLVYSDEFNATGVLTCNNQPLEGETVYLMIGSYVAGTDVTDSDGSVSFTASPVHAGRHTFSLVYHGSRSYYGCENSATIDVSKETSFLNMTNKNTFYTNEDVILTGVLLDDEQEPIVGKYVAPFGVTDSNGVFSANMGRVSVGTYNFDNVITFTDDDYTGNTISHTIQVVEPYIDLTSDKSILSYADGDTATLTATIHNKTVNGVTVTFYDGNDNVIGTGTTDNTGEAVCNNRYDAQGIGDVTLKAEASVDGSLLSKTYEVSDRIKYDDATSDNRSKYDTTHMNLSVSYDSTNKYYYISNSANNNAYHNYLIIDDVEVARGVELAFDVNTTTTNNSLHEILNGVGLYNSSNNGLIAFAGKNHSRGYQRQATTNFSTETTINSTPTINYNHSNWYTIKYKITTSSMTLYVYQEDTLITSEELTNTYITSDTNQVLIYFTCYNGTTKFKNISVKSL